MLAGSERQQGFFDAAWCAGLLAENSIYALLARHGDRIVRDEDFAECYSARWGRPSIAPSLLAKVLLLAYRNGLSDRRAMEALRFDLRWKVALDLPIDHPGFHPTSLVKFRARLLLHGKERIVFERSLELADRARAARRLGRADRRLDADARRGRDPGHGHAGPRRGAQADRRGQALDPRAGAQLRSALAFDYARPRQKPAADWHDKAGARGDAGRGRHRRPARAARGRAATASWSPTRRSARPRGCWREIVGQEFEPAEDDRTRRARVTAAGRGRSSPRMTRRCATAARPTRAASPATSCTSPPTRRRRW